MQIYRQAAQLMPTGPQPYMHGLMAAQRIGDLEGIQWATLGILSQAWPGDHQEIWNAGLFAAKACWRSSQRESRRGSRWLREGLDEAVRDCVVMVSWTGEADVECWSRSPRDGLLSAQSSHHRRRRDAGRYTSPRTRRLGGGLSEVYVCPKGFTGNYRLLVRRVWGN